MRGHNFCQSAAISTSMLPLPVGGPPAAAQSSGALRVWLGADGLQVRERRHDRPRWWDAVRRQRAGGLSYRPEEERPDAPED